MLIAGCELICGEIPDAFGRQAEQQSQCTGGADIDGESDVAQASLEELPAIVVSEQLGWLLTWDGGHDELS